MSELHFVCGQCNSPLEIDSSLQNISVAHAKLLVSRNSESFRLLQLENAKQCDPQNFIPKDRLEMYLNAVKDTESTTRNTRNLMQSVDSSLEESSKGADTESEIQNLLQQEHSSSYVLVNNIASKSENEKGPCKNFDPDTHPISLRIKTLSEIFDILSSHQDIDHPLGQDCAELLLDNLGLKFDQTQIEKDNYLTFLRKLKEKEAHERAEDQGNLFQNLSTELVKTREEYHHLSLEESTKLAELKSLEDEKIQLELQLKDLDAQVVSLRNSELADLFSINNLNKLETAERQNYIEQVSSAYNINLTHLHRLRNTNIYTLMFDISVDLTHKYGTINGHRLGHSIDWQEINAALGQCVLLLDFLATTLGTDLKDFELVPMGSQSKIIKKNANLENGNLHDNLTVLLLYNSKEFSLGKLFNYNKMDISMILLLQIVDMVLESLSRKYVGASLPYPISKSFNLIGSKSIRVTSNSEWTASCRLLLTDLNWILSHVAATTQIYEGA